MYAKLLIKQAYDYTRDTTKNPRKGVKPVAPGSAPTTKPEPEPEYDWSDMFGGREVPEGVKGFSQNVGKGFDVANARLSDMWHNKLATALGLPVGFWASTDGRQLLSKFIQEGKGNVGVPHPIQSYKATRDVLAGQGVRTPAKAWKDISGSVSRRDFINQVKPRANPIKAVKEVNRVRNLRKLTPKGPMRAVLDKVLSGNFGKAIFHNPLIRKPGQTKGGWKRLTAATLASSVAAAMAAAKIKSEMGKRAE